MTSLFNYHDDSADPLLVELGQLRTVFGLDPEHVLADPRAPMILDVGPGKSLSSKDLRWLLHLRAEAALARRMGRRVENEDLDDYPSLARSLQEFKQEVARYTRRATDEPEPAGSPAQFYQLEPGWITEPVPAD